jgi:micrococcal nuclease
MANINRTKLIISLTLAAAGLAIAVVCLPGGRQVAGKATAALAAAQPGLYPVVHVTDGDTIIVRTPTGEETVRLLGVDTPEVKDPRKPVQCFGPEASAHSKQLLTGRAVRLAPDSTDTDRDKYGRLLRYVYLPDGTLVNAELIRDGFGFAYTVFPLEKLNDFRALERAARSAGRGLWSTCRVDESQIIKQTAGAK